MPKIFSLFSHSCFSSICMCVICCVEQMEDYQVASTVLLSSHSFLPSVVQQVMRLKTLNKISDTNKTKKRFSNYITLVLLVSDIRL